MLVPSVAWRDQAVVLLDQTGLPLHERVVRCADVPALVDAIRHLVVRGAPALGIAGAYGVALAAAADPREGPLRRAAGQLAGARPTAVNLRRETERVLHAALRRPELGRPDAALEEARRVEEEDRAASAAMAQHGLALVPAGARVLTHCNTGALVSAGGGTAFAVIEAAHRAGRLAHLWVDETRPLLQGSRLTAWEAGRAGIEHSVLPDSAAASLMAQGLVDLVLVGADRVCADGSVANKVGTYPLALVAHAHDVPFVVVAPTSTVDLTTACGADVEIEQRDAGELLELAGRRLAPVGTAGYNPAFDVTPPHLVSALVTEKGVVHHPVAASVAALGQAQ